VEFHDEGIFITNNLKHNKNIDFIIHTTHSFELSWLFFEFQKIINDLYIPRKVKLKEVFSLSYLELGRLVKENLCKKDCRTILFGDIVGTKIFDGPNGGDILNFTAYKVYQSFKESVMNFLLNDIQNIYN
jgi:hypothetical protein